MLRSALTRDLILSYGSLENVPESSGDLVISESVSARRRKFIVREHDRIIKNIAAREKEEGNKEVLRYVG